MSEGKSDAKWVCASCGARYAERNPPCLQCAGEEFARLNDDGTDRITDRADVTYRCRDCGRKHPRNSPPCNNCGGMDFETVGGVNESPSTATDTDDSPGLVEKVRGVVPGLSRSRTPPSGPKSHSVLNPRGPFRPVRRWLGWGTLLLLALVIITGLLSPSAGLLAAFVWGGWVLPGAFSLWVLFWFIDMILAYLKS